jgi:K+-sensing histidine kinase KdpD
VNDGVAAVPDGDPARRSAASLYPFLPHVFDRFYRATQSRGLPGAGLGLAIVCQVADAHGGAVAATNAEGGALLRMCLPTAASSLSKSLPVS